jgi:hypothetical protein
MMLGESHFPLQLLRIKNLSPTLTLPLWGRG